MALATAGVQEAVRAEAVPVRGGIAMRAGRVLGGLTFREPVLCLPQHRTEAILSARLCELAPDALVRGAEVRAVRSDERGAEIDTTDETLRARVVVGADGTRSLVRRAAGIGWRRIDAGAAYVMADADGGTGRPDRAVLHLESDGVVESFPLPGGRRRWVVRADDPGEWTREGFAELVGTRTGAALRGLDPPSSFTASQHLATRFARGTALLVGDAAHEVSPIGGQGMNLGWLDALALSRAFGTGGATDGGLDGDAWARDRRSKAVIAQRRARFNAAMGAPRAGAALLVRDAAVRALAGTPLRTLARSAFTMRGLSSG